MPAKGLRRWERILKKLFLWMHTMVRQMIMTKTIREMKHRAPALMGLMQALTDLEMPAVEEMPPRPISSMAKGQTPMNPTATYQVDPAQCPHLVEHGKRYGNAKGKFMECINCGSVWRGIDYAVPPMVEMVTTYKIFLGVRDRPGGKVLKGMVSRPKPKPKVIGQIIWLLILLSTSLGGGPLHDARDIGIENLFQDSGYNFEIQDERTSPGSVGLEWRRGRDASGSDGKRLKPGQVKRMAGIARQALESSKWQRKMVEQRFMSSRWPRKHFKYDLVEIFGGSSMITIRGATLWRMRALQPIDIRYGIDLRRL